MANVSNQNGNLVVRGSVIKVRRRCGKSNCKCVHGQMHETWALSYSHRGRTKMIPLREEDIRIARLALQRYQKALAQLELQALKGIKKLHATIKTAKRNAR